MWPFLFPSPFGFSQAIPEKKLGLNQAGIGSETI